MRELESYAGDPSNLVMSGKSPLCHAIAVFSSRVTATGVSGHSPGSSSSGSSVAEMPSTSHRPVVIPEVHGQPPQVAMGEALESETDESTSDEEDEAADIVPQAITTPHAANQLNRPQSSLSSSRPYRTPMASTMFVASPPPVNVPQTQPHPGFQTQSAFAESATSIPSSVYPTTSVSYPEQLARSPPTDPASSVHGYSSRAGFRPTTQTPYRQYSLQSGGGVPPRPASIPMLERAVESVQAHLAAITERLETLEGLLHHSTASLSHSGLRSPALVGGRGSPFGGAQDVVRWDIDDMGMWSLVLQPLARVFRLFRQLMAFLANSDNRSPTFVVIRRLFLDISFVLCVLAAFKLSWRRSGVRRREVAAALQGLWRAIVGQQVPRHMVERGV